MRGTDKVGYSEHYWFINLLFLSHGIPADSIMSIISDKPTSSTWHPPYRLICELLFDKPTLSVTICLSNLMSVSAIVWIIFDKPILRK